ncbi:MAG: TetR family transcriptional regulator [Selenomonadaceae bacterium]|nr:TetR family transcriptional regulator [Selenomonadaceae bacterium]
MLKGSPEFTVSRKNEIVSACAELYKKFSFKDITLQKIGDSTTFTRTSIYNYFQTKEEIFLALLQREYELWIEELDEIEKNNSALTREEFADKLSKSLEHREVLLKLMSMNHFDMERCSRLENLIDFKRSYGESLKAVKRCLDKFFPKMTAQEKETFMYIFFPFVYGIYPYVIVTDKQKQAMDAAETNFVYHTIYELAYKCLIKILPEEMN